MKPLASFAIALCLVAPVAAHAAASQETLALPVSHADLDLAQPQDAATMLTRLDRAALTACGASAFSFRQVQDEVRASRCYRQSMDRAVTDLAAPGVTRLYQERLPQVAAN